MFTFFLHFQSYVVLNPKCLAHNSWNLPKTHELFLCLVNVLFRNIYSAANVSPQDLPITSQPEQLRISINVFFDFSKTDHAVNLHNHSQSLFYPTSPNSSSYPSIHLCLPYAFGIYVLMNHAGRSNFDAVRQTRQTQSILCLCTPPGWRWWWRRRLHTLSCAFS